MEQIPDHRLASDEPLLNIGVVSRLTSISVATLRAWERRYGYPTSARTVGGHRLYSERDVLRLRWIKAQIDQGLQTSQAVQMLRHRENRGAQHVKEDPAISPLPPGVPVEAWTAEPRLTGLAGLSASRAELIAALLRYDLATADQILGETLLAFSLDEVIFGLIQPTLDEIGLAWQGASLAVADEHLATQYLRHRLFAWLLAGPPPYPEAPVVLACAPGELHEGSLLILGALLRQRQRPVAYLGQNTPLADLSRLVAEVRPPAVVLLAMTEGPAAQLAEWPRYLPEVSQDGRPIVAYGGRIFSERPEWRARTPGLFLGETLPEGLERLDRLLREYMSGPAGSAQTRTNETQPH
ncbi:MAG TPA: MerR family transcriptional regulator [Anaerolineae bacterium]